MSRLSAALAGIAVLTACTGADSSLGPDESSSASSSAPADDLLLPNMRSLAAADLHVVEEKGERRLRFAGSLANLGQGPLAITPRNDRRCPRGQIAVSQLIHRDAGRNGAFDRGKDPVDLRRPAGCMLDHPTHQHWHVDATARYSLTEPEGRIVVSRNKVSFCLRDNERAGRSANRVGRAYFGECARRTNQGISPGWMDIYTADLDGQYLTLPDDTPRGTLCLVVTADPRDLFLETDEDDNATTIPVRIRGSDVDVVRSGCG